MQEKEIIIEKENIKLISDNNKYIIIVKDDLKEEDFEKFKEITMWESYIDSERWILLDLDFDQSMTQSIFYTIKELLKSNNLLNSLHVLSKKFSFKTPKDKYLKFRGDYAEAAYLYKNPKARKLNDHETADINDEGEIIEIKSYSTQKNQVRISLKQIRENTTKLAFPLLNDTDGKNIIELSQSIDDISFKEYLIDQYKNTEYEHIKYTIDKDFLNINDQIKEFVLPKNIIKADFVINIKQKPGLQ